jgi:broad specificity phosphatase PhoE
VGDLFLIRHGETSWSATGRHTSSTDLPLTGRGEQQSRVLAGVLDGHRFAAVLCSPRRRAVRTAELAGLAVTQVLDDLTEWNYGRYEGVTTAQIRAQRPDWVLWTDGCPDGESPAQVGSRLDRVLAHVGPLLAGGDVALIGHAHALRVAGARWIGLPVTAGALLRLDAARICRLGREHARPVILGWNCPVPP